MEPRWLASEQEHAWRAYCALTLLLEDTIDQQLRRDTGMTHLHYRVLVFLSDRPDQRLRMTDLAECLKIARTRLSYTIQRMEDAGWVRREDCPDDKRSQLAVLTDEGMQALKGAAPGHVSLVRTAVFDRLTHEQSRAFGEACQIILTGLIDPDGAAPDTNLPWRR
ncbi:MarR family winged helix-turn-helix transcriptional regulator [Streptomyces griseofuscus]|uniref:MarR family winged helix-turn-helix transcriptional regulator n=1 Tax=Streptomyces griseofuscus TaxID=146922 RepID=UPI003456A750